MRREPSLPRESLTDFYSILKSPQKNPRLIYETIIRQTIERSARIKSEF
jgi:hypothetical protein